ncbi:MAG TPA: recombinase family protein [Candidatus Krumholzibacteria bacterium]|nr:recombinase family protein [Candidatus Krumholzibacteria bacterium]HPD73296.1 recombinase family protein [Candidatus Krumholzibacteria bacterium]HRY42012.1 recombinase family protein [Candidatus Krumholzibacteria bacterium]
MAPRGSTHVQQTRVAIYTRKSTDEGLDQDFNSLDAQREAGEAYVASQRGQGWICLEERYDDGGWSGGNLDRPALHRLLDDIKADRVDCVICYKVDRLSRSLLDFARLVELFDKHQVSLVSVTQPINTADSTGRLMLNILLSFAQFERELVADRTRDKVHAARRKGKWTGGVPILGYRVASGGGRLEIDPEGAEMVREIFALYLADQSVAEVVEEINCRGWTTKEHVTKTGRRVGGLPFNKSSVTYLLKNPTYNGKLMLKGEVFDGEHEAIIDDVTFQRVQDLLKKNGTGRGGPNGNKYGYLLKGLVRCAACGAAMTPSTSRRGSKVYRYYTCTSAQKRGYASCPCPTIPARKLEDVIVQQIRVIGQDRELQRATLAQVRSGREARRPALVGEQKRLRRRLEKVRGDIRSLLDALAVGERGASVGARIAELEAEAEKLERRFTEVAQELAALDADAVDEADLRKALSLFDPIWGALWPSEQARIIQLLIERIEHDARTGTLAIEFAPLGIRALAGEVDAATTTVTA